MTQSEKAERLLALHRAPPVLVLPNAWDVSSALVIAATPGCRAIATTSSGVAATLGYADGELIPPDLMLGAVERIARAVDLPVTADLESGYGDASRTAEAALAAGVVGLNLEDGHDRRDPPLVPLERHVGGDPGRARGGACCRRPPRDQRAHRRLPPSDGRAGGSVRGGRHARERLPRRGRGLRVRARRRRRRDDRAAGARRSTDR